MLTTSNALGWTLQPLFESRVVTAAYEL